MPNISDYFSSTKLYKELKLKPGALANGDDWNWIQDIANYDRREMAKFLQGFQLTTNDTINTPVLKVKANYDLTEGQIITVEVVDATHARWSKNGGAWSGSIVVICDSISWNTLGTSGLDVVFLDTAVGLDRSEVWVAQGMRLLGGEIDAPVANSFRLNEGKWAVLGEFEDFTAAVTVAGAANGDYLYLKVETTAVTYGTDSELGHRLADGNDDPESPDAYNRVYTLMSGAVFPDNTSSPYVQYFIVGKVINAAAGTFTYMWNESNDIQKIMRLYGDTTPPNTPTGLALTTGSDSSFVSIAVDRTVGNIPAVGYLGMSCDDNNEPDVEDYEFKVVRLVVPGGAPTVDSLTYFVKSNADNGGAGIPLGVEFVLHSQSFGIPYGVFVRAIDKAGNVGPWSTRVDEVIGGTVSDIALGDAGPTFSLTDIPGFVGVEVVIGALPAGADGFSIWVGEGSYSVTTPGLEYGKYGSSIGTVQIPWKESGRPYIRLKAFDEKGLYQALVSEDNVSLEATAQLSTETHNSSLSSHSGLLSGIASIESRYGKFENWAAIIEAQGFAIDNTYIVSNQGGFYTTLQAALDAVEHDLPSFALILLCPDFTDSGGVVTFPSMTDVSGASTKVVIQGLGTQCYISDDIDLSNLSALAVPLSAPITANVAQLILQDIVVTGRIFSTKTAVPYGAIAMNHCEVTGHESVNPLIDLDAIVGGGHYVFLKDCTFTNFGANYVMALRGYCDLFMEDCSVCLYNSVTGTAIYFDTPTTSMRRITGTLIDVNGSTTGLAVDASGAINLMMNRCDYRRANGANVTLVTGSVSNNSVWTSDFIYN